ncbi:MAG: SDR family oxidoreductase [Planctomycetota bacterium]
MTTLTSTTDVSRAQASPFAAASLFSLEGRTAVLTGASGFLGRAMARGLLANGARLVALGRSERLAGEAASWRGEFGEDRVVDHRLDMDDGDELSDRLMQIAATERVDVLVNNAHDLGPATGFNDPSGRIESDEALAAIERNLAAGVGWAAATCRVFGGQMRAQGRGSIVNISTMYAKVAPDPALYEGTEFMNPVGYAPSKAGLEALTRYLASFWGADGVRVNAIAPGPFSNTEDQTANSVDPDDPFLLRLKERTCLGRTGRSGELVGALLYLASEASSYVTGQTLVVDGGWTVR